MEMICSGNINRWIQILWIICPCIISYWKYCSICRVWATWLFFPTPKSALLSFYNFIRWGMLSSKKPDNYFKMTAAASLVFVCKQTPSPPDKEQNDFCFNYWNPHLAACWWVSPESPLGFSADATRDLDASLLMSGEARWSASCATYTGR